MNPITRYSCPLSTCHWHYDAATPGIEATAGLLPDPSARTLSEITASIASQVMERHAQAIEAVISEHFAVHPTVDWVREMNRLQGILRALGSEPTDGKEPPC